MKRIKSLKSKIVLNTVLLLVLISMLNLVTGIFVSYQGLKSSAKNDLKTIGETAQIAISNALDSRKKEIMMISASGNSVSGQNQDVSSVWMPILKQKQEKNGYKALYIADSSGKILSTDSAYNGKNIVDADYFKNAVAGETYISTTLKNINDEVVVFLSTPFSYGDFHGALIAELDCQVYSNIVKNVVVGKTGNIFILDKSANMIASKWPQLVIDRTNFIEKAKQDKGYAASAKVYEKMKAGQIGIEEYSYDNGKRLCYYKPIAGTDGWSCGVVVPTQEMLSVIYQIILAMSAVSLVLGVLGIIAMFRLAEGISAPVRNCSDRLTKLAQGDIQSEVPTVNTQDETRQLADATQTLLQNLRAIINDETYLLGEMSRGNLDVTSDCDYYVGDFQPLQASIHQIIDSFNHTLTRMKQMAIQVANSSVQMASGAETLSQGTTEQAASIEELSATLEDITQQVKKSAKHASDANVEVTHVGQELEESSCKMVELVNAMSDISNASAEIKKIMKVIDDIAFQTNILALNAAVEAARAGDAGKGFAVVAQEVRNLAVKSAKASNSTASLIESSMSAVEKGGKAANETAQFLSTVVDGSKEIVVSVSKISEASELQATAIDQVTQGLEQISAVVQTNSATAEESAATSSELSSQAGEMQKLAARFRMKDDNNESHQIQDEF